jgi:hypothetical protein
MALCVLGSPMEAKFVLNRGLSTNGLGTPNKFYFFTFFFASLKLSMEFGNINIQL